MKTFLILGLTLFSMSAWTFELIAHRGVHQNYHRENLRPDTCTATRIENSGHPYLENTVASIREAFRLGASMVEVDLHPTTETDGRDDQMVVFHDWTLDCRTEARCDRGCACENGSCVTGQQTVAYLKTLDLGFGYTFDGGQTFPFRGQGVGQMPTLEEVLDLLVEFPDKKLTFNQKDRFKRTTEIFLRIASRYPVDVRRRMFFEYHDFDHRPFETLEIQEAIYQGGGPAKACFRKYALMGWTGYFPDECRNTKLFVPLHETLGLLHPSLQRVRATDVLWGWPDRFLERARENGTKIYVSQVDSEEDLNFVRTLAIEGFMTNKIEVIAPLLRADASND